MKLRRSCILLAVASFAMATAANAAVIRVGPNRPITSIQAGVDLADPGDTILVDPGTYMEPGPTYGVHVTKNNIRLIGRVKPWKGEAGKVRVVATGTQQTGIYAAPPGCEFNDPEGSCPDTLYDFYVRGFTVEGFPKNGIQTRWVDGFKFIKNESIDNLDNGIYPTLSANGLVLHNSSYGSLDTALWVAGSSHVRVIGNKLTEAPTGFEITVSNDVYAAFNFIYNNTVGVGLYHPNAAGNPPLPVMEDWVFEYNYILNNNLLNPAPPGTFQAGLLPGYGVLLLGVSGHEIRRNYIAGNDAAGAAVLGWCTATALGDPSRSCFFDSVGDQDPSSNDNRIADNLLVNNGGSPPPIGLPGVDLLYLQTPIPGVVSPPPPAGLTETGVGNCFEGNTFDTFVSFPLGPPGVGLPPPAGLPGPLPTDGC